MYAGVGTFSITSLPCVRGCRGTHRTLYATLGTPPCTFRPKGIDSAASRKAGRLESKGRAVPGSSRRSHASAGPERGRLGGIGLALGAGDWLGVGALPHLRIRLLAARKARKPLDIKGIRRRAPPHWAKKKPPAQEPRA